MAVTMENGTTIYEGCVLRKYQKACCGDLDYYAECVNIENGTIDTVEYDTTRFYGGGSAKIDITKENFRAYLHKAHARLLREEIAKDRKRAQTIDKGKQVVVVGGRKVPLGTSGEVFWVKEVNYDLFGRWRGIATRIGFKDADGNVYWTNACNVKVVSPEQYCVSVQELNRLVKRQKSHQYIGMFGKEAKV